MPYAKFYCNVCGDPTDRLHQSEHWDGSLLMVCRACAPESIDPPVRELNPFTDDTRRRRELEAWEAFRADRRHRREAFRDARGSSGDMAL